MRPNDGKVWRKNGRNGREGRQALTPQVRQAVAFAREMHALETALSEPGGNVVRFTWDRSELVTLGGVS